MKSASSEVKPCKTGSGKVENFKSVFLIDNILGKIAESGNELQDGKVTLYFYTRDEDD